MSTQGTAHLLQIHFLDAICSRTTVIQPSNHQKLKICQLLALVKNVGAEGMDATRNFIETLHDFEVA